MESKIIITAGHVLYFFNFRRYTKIEKQNIGRIHFDFNFQQLMVKQLFYFWLYCLYLIRNKMCYSIFEKIMYKGCR